MGGPLLAGALSLAAYLATLCPSVYVEGAGELIGATYKLGTPHPTGYPLFCLLGRTLAALLPFGSPAYQVNAFSALGSAAAVGVLGALLQRRGLSPGLALGASLAFAFTGTFWSQAVIAEVYGLAMLGAVLFLWAGVVAAEGRGQRCWLLLAYLAGLGLTLHLSLVLLWPGMALLWWLSRRGMWGDLHLLLKGLGCFTLGYSPVIYLFIRNGDGDAFHWGTIHSAGQWIDHLNGALYRDSFFSLPPAAMLLNLQRWGEQMLVEFHPVLLPLLLWGGWAGRRRDRGLWLLAVGGLVCNLVVALNYHRDPNGIGVFFLLSVLAGAFFLSWGLQDLIERWGKGRRVAWLAGVAVAGGVFLAHLSTVDRSGIWIPHQYGVDILSGLPENAILLAEGDDAAFILDYLQRLEGLRPDVALYNRLGRGRDLLQGNEHELNPLQQARLRAQREVQLLEGSRPVHYLYARRLPAEGFRLVPAGLSYRVWPRTQASPPSLGQVPPIPPAAVYNPDPWVRKLQANYAFMQGEALLAQADTAAALEAYREAGARAWDSRSTQFNLALILLRCNQLEEAWSRAEVAAALDPWNPELHRLRAQIRARQGRGSDSELLLK
ncbi:MAG: DUF2723 domain-containing protein [Candidatus Handelsmanbacteria bacterium]|nr:DUF2723 domain-containing protein [Candidatus Handelsmanbacteria bacterium]